VQGIMCYLYLGMPAESGEGNGKSGDWGNQVPAQRQATRHTRNTRNLLDSLAERAERAERSIREETLQLERSGLRIKVVDQPQYPSSPHPKDVPGYIRAVCSCLGRACNNRGHESMNISAFIASASAYGNQDALTSHPQPQRASLSSLRNFIWTPYFHASSKVRKRPLSSKMVCLVHYLVIILLPHFPQSSGSTSLTNRMKRRRDETRHSSDSLVQDAARLDILSPSRAAGHHLATRHALTKKRAKAINSALAVWFPNVHDTRRMPWRKPFDPTLSSEARGQRAYEVCTSDTG
jgi:hypothetical protein